MVISVQRLTSQISRSNNFIEIAKTTDKPKVIKVIKTIPKEPEPEYE